jgi:orotidine-5'-phosphate decarboxylase
VAKLLATPIVALDVPGADAALGLVRRLEGRCGFYKVGGELFTASGPRVVEEICALGHEVFLDLKFHDIPNTVAGSVRSAVRLGATMLTVHAAGGDAMMRAAVDAAGTDCRVMGVTVLTSLDAASLAAAWGRAAVSLDEEVERLAGICVGAGTHGVVCSGHEAARIRARYPTLAPLVPGIRFADGAAHDQARVMTPRRAAEAGARYLVLGRAVTAAADPSAAMERVLAELR